MFCLVTVVKTNLSLASVFLSCCCMNCKLSLLFFLQTLYVIEWPSCWSWDKILRVVGYSSVSHGQDQDSASFRNLVLENTLKDVVADMILVTSTIKCQLVLKCVLKDYIPNVEQQWQKCVSSTIPNVEQQWQKCVLSTIPSVEQQWQKCVSNTIPNVPQQWQKIVSSIISPVCRNSDRKVCQALYPQCGAIVTENVLEDKGCRHGANHNELCQGKVCGRWLLIWCWIRTGYNCREVVAHLMLN